MPSLFPEPCPALPPFQTLLLHGKFHPSAPIHLAFSSVSASTRGEVILVTPSRQSLVSALGRFNDDWIRINSGTGKAQNISPRVKIFYPPSPAHMCFLLSSLTVAGVHGMDEGELKSRVVLPCPPTLIIILEPSYYFLPESETDANNSQGWTVSSYTMLVMHILSSLTQLSMQRSSRYTGFDPIPLAVFDSHLDELRLPTFPATNDVTAMGRPDSQPTFIIPLLSKYFEWIGHAYIEEKKNDEDRVRVLRLGRANQDAENAEVWRWREVFGSDEGVQVQGVGFEWTF